MRAGIQPIKNTVESVIKSWEVRKFAAGDTPEKLLKYLLTKKELEHAGAKYFKNGVLGIAVDSSGWHYHLALKKEDLLNKLRKKYSVAKDIKFHIGEVDGKEKNKAR